MIDNSEIDKEVLNEKFKILLEEDNQIKKWNEGLLIKSMILLPLIIFVVGLFFINRPENFKELIFLLLYPLFLISIGVTILFFMTRSLK